MSVSSGSSDRTLHLTRMLYKRPYEKLMRLGLGDLAVVGNRPLPEKVASVAEWETKYGSLLDAATNMLAESIAGTLVLQLLLHTTGEGLRSAQRDGVFFRFPLPVFSLTDRRTPLPPLLPASPSSCSSARGRTSRPPLAPPRTSPS